MDRASTVWVVIFFLSAILFFAIAAVIAVKGLADLKKLLGHSKRHGQEGDLDQARESGTDG